MGKPNNNYSSEGQGGRTLGPPEQDSMLRVAKVHAGSLRPLGLPQATQGHTGPASREYRECLHRPDRTGPD
eukprot:15441208-Alexandrium_andersonii.AAC.1